MKHNHDFSHIETCEIRGKKFQISWRGHATYHGACDPPHGKNPKLNIQKTESPLTVLMTTIEEVFHGAFFDLDDGAVKRTMRDLRRLTKRMGLRVSFQSHAKKD